MEAIRYFYDEVTNTLEKVLTEQSKNITKAAMVIADTIEEGGMFHVFGTGGHSNIAAIEMCHRAGNLCCANAILDPGTNVIHGAKRSNIIERTPGYARAVFDAYRLKEGDALVIVNAYGINSMTVDSALLCKERGIKSIGITSTSFAHTVPKDAPSRHPSGQNLCDLVDVYIDNHLPYGDAVVQIGDMQQKMGSTSTYANCFAMNLLMMETANTLLEMGITPAVWMSANLPDGDRLNREYEEKYLPQIRHL